MEGDGFDGGICAGSVLEYHTGRETGKARRDKINPPTRDLNSGQDLTDKERDN